MANWQKLNTRKLSPDVLKKIMRVVGAANDGIATALSVTKSALNAARLLATAASVNPIEMALRAAVKEIEDFVTGLAAQSTAHLLVIPIQKQYTGIDFLSDIEKFSLDSWIDKVPGEGTYAQEVYRLNTPDTLSFINHASDAAGGNAGYWRTLVLSLSDTGDFARPLFPTDYAVAGVAIICGANTLNVLGPVLDIFNHILFMGTRGSLTSRILPAPQGLRARVIPIPNKQTLGVQLNWPMIPPVLLRPAFTTEHFKVRNILVIRSIDPMIRERFTWAQNFSHTPELLGNTDPTVKTFDIDKTLETQVIAQIKNTGFINGYVDAVPLEDGARYYYALAVIYEIGGVLQPVSNLSNVEIVYFNNTITTSRLSEPPDWFATPSAVQLFPILHSVLGEIKLFVAKTLTRTTSNNGVINLLLQLIAQINLLLQDAQRIAGKLRLLEDRLRYICTAEAAGIRTTHIEIESGGMYAWTHELARRLSDSTDPSRPPYDHNELVAGFVIVAGAPRLPQFKPFRDLLKLFFGESSSSPLEDALRTIDVTTQTGGGLRAGEMSSGRGNAVSVPIPAPDGRPRAPVGFDAKLKPVTKAQDAVTASPPSKKPAGFDKTLTPSDRSDDC